NYWSPGWKRCAKTSIPLRTCVPPVNWAWARARNGCWRGWRGAAAPARTGSDTTPPGPPRGAARAVAALLRRAERLLLVPVDQSLEIGTGTELRHEAGRNIDRGAGGGVPRRTCSALGLLENTEAGDGDLVARGHGALNGLEHSVDRFGRGLLVSETIGDRVDQVTLVHKVPPVPPCSHEISGSRGLPDLRGHSLLTVGRAQCPRRRTPFYTVLGASNAYV